MSRFMAVVIIDDQTARIVARGSRELCVRVAAEYAVLETVVMPSRF